MTDDTQKQDQSKDKAQLQGHDKAQQQDKSKVPSEGQAKPLNQAADKAQKVAAEKTPPPKRTERKAPVKSPEEKVQTAQNREPAQVIQKSGGKGLSFFAILLSLGALAGSGYTWYQTQIQDVQRESNLTVGVSQIGAQVSRFGDAISRLQQDQADVVSKAELENRLMQASRSTEQSIQTIASEQKAVQDSVLQLSSELQRGVDQFTIEEVSQLLRLANNSVLFGEDIESAVNALELADAQLKGLKDPSFAVVRTQINAELAALKTVALPDVEAISGQLRAIKSKVKELPLAHEPDKHEIRVATAEGSSEPMTWRSELVKVWRDLIGSISIQRVDQPPKPLLVPEQRYFLNENIGLAISKAELALLQGQGRVFQQSLEEASQWLRDYFDLDNVAVADAIQQLNALSSSSVTVEIPNITGSYQSLQSLVGGQ